MTNPNNQEQRGYPSPPEEAGQAPGAQEQAAPRSEVSQQNPARPAGPEAQGPAAYQAPPPPQPNYAPSYYGVQPPQTNPGSYQNSYYGQPPYGQPAPPPPPPSPYPQQPLQPPPPYPPRHPYKPEGLAIASMVLGICSIVFGSLVCAILALVFSSRVKSHYPNGNLGPNATYAKVGKICGAVGLGISIFIILFVIVFLIIFFTSSPFNYYYNFPYYLVY